MSESTTSQSATAASSAVTRGSGPAPALQSDRGKTTLADTVATKVAGIAAREVRGVHALGGGVGRALAGVGQRVGLSDGAGQGVWVEVGEREAAVDLSLVVDWGESVPQVCEAVRANVIKRIEGICGLSVTEVNVTVNDLFFPGDDEPETESRVQ